jgi:hypothetical protein
MNKTRRDFMLTLAWIGGGLVAEREPLRAQESKHRPGYPDPPTPGDPQERDKNADPADPKVSQKRILKQNEKDFRMGVEKLCRMAGELREELDKTPTTDVLSVRMYKRMQEIEKLAKQLKDKAKG